VSLLIAEGAHPKAIQDPPWAQGHTDHLQRLRPHAPLAQEALGAALDAAYERQDDDVPRIGGRRLVEVAAFVHDFVGDVAKHVGDYRREERMSVRPSMGSAPIETRLGSSLGVPQCLGHRQHLGALANKTHFGSL